ncbi:hypothetical protein ACTPOK_25610 [Streptomyces inhibens]|uniref:hypothetical protein n=1 Tax=Streptomyces inhibens TaxID=2293571 RepID=UPI00402AFB80
MPKTAPHPRAQARWALAAVATGAFCVQLAPRPSLALPAAVCLAAAGALALVRVLRREGRRAGGG